MATAQLEISPLQWAHLKKLGEIEPLNDSDLQCMAEVRKVLIKHGKRDRFGLALLHKHFDMDDNEVLLESTDKQARELNIRPVKRDEAADSVPTIWMLLDDQMRSIQDCSRPGPDKDDCFY